MKKLSAILLSVLMIFCLLCACSNNSSVNESNAQISAPAENPDETHPFLEYFLSSKENISSGAEISAPYFSDFEHICLYDGDSSPIISMTEEERAEFLEIIGAYEMEETEEIDPAIGTMDRSIIFTSEEKGAALYIKELAGEGLISMKRNSQTEMEAFDVSGDIYYDMEDLRNKIQKSSRKDGRWPFLFPAEENYLHSVNPPEFNEEHFLSELKTFIDCIIGDFDSETNRLGPERTLHYCLWKVWKDYDADGKSLPWNDDGQSLVPEDEVNRIAKYVFGIADFSSYNPAENGYYAVPFDARITRYKVENIQTDGSYVFCDVIFTDPDDVDFEWEPLAKKNFCFIRFEAEGEVFYRPVSSFCESGEEYGF